MRPDCLVAATSRAPGDAARDGGSSRLRRSSSRELPLGADVRVPDLAGGRRERMPRVPDTAWFELAADWVCEVVSPSTGRLDRTAKMPAYARDGVAFTWRVDPLQRLVSAQPSPPFRICW